MDTIMAMAFVTLGVLFISILGYTITTESIIKDQEKEIQRLKRRNREWRS